MGLPANKKVKILMICDFYGIGQQYQENMIAKYYALMGHEVHIIANNFTNVFNYINDINDNSRAAYTENDGYATIYRTAFRFKYKKLFKLYTNIRQRVEEIAPDLIYFHNLSLNLHEVIPYTRENKNTRIIMDFHIDYSNIGQSWKSLHILHGFIRKNYLKAYLKHIAVVYPIVPNGMDFIQEIYGVPAEKTRLLPLGYDEIVADEIRQNTDRKAIRNKIGIKDDDFLIISGGKFNEEKRTELLIEAANLLEDNQIHILIFGAASAKEQAYANKLKEIANANVQFLGWLSGQEILTYMHAADLAVYPSSQSVLWQQSIGMYLPLILGDAGNQDPTYLNRNDNIIVLKKEEINTPTIAQWIKTIKNDKCLYRSMKLGAEKTAQEYLRYTRICQTTIDDAFSA